MVHSSAAKYSIQLSGLSCRGRTLLKGVSLTSSCPHSLMPSQPYALADLCPHSLMPSQTYVLTALCPHTLTPLCPYMPVHVVQNPNTVPLACSQQYLGKPSTPMQPFLGEPSMPSSVAHVMPLLYEQHPLCLDPAHVGS